MANRTRIRRKLARVFVIQLAFISLAALLGVIAARFVLGNILIHQALRDEAAHFWGLYGADVNCPLPDTHNMKGYLTPRQAFSAVPADTRDLAEGFHELPRADSFVVAYVTRQDAARLTLIFDGQRVEELAVFFGMIPLAAGLIGIYVATFVGYRLSATVVSPILQLAEKVDRIERDSPDKSLHVLENLPDAEDEEVQTLSQALSRLSTRILHFIERERTFTRDVSHELRTPITIIRMAIDMILADTTQSPASRTKLQRVKRAAHDMEELTNAFLLLSRESEQGLPCQRVCLMDVAAEEIERSRPLLENKAIDISLTGDDQLFLHAPEKVLAILIGNLIRNAFAYTDAGYVRISIDDGRMTIEDSGSGIDEAQMDRVFDPHFRGSARVAGHGVGLTIVKRLSDRFGWPVRMVSKPGFGTIVTVQFSPSA